MNEPRKQPAPRPFSPTEYIGPVLAILLVLLVAGWYLGRLWGRIREQPPAPGPELRLNVPRDNNQ
jgi:hypothetical protein